MEERQEGGDHGREELVAHLAVAVDEEDAGHVAPGGDGFEREVVGHLPVDVGEDGVLVEVVEAVGDIRQQGVDIGVPVELLVEIGQTDAETADERCLRHEPERITRCGSFHQGVPLNGDCQSIRRQELESSP